MQDGATLKKKFDDIFQATRYTMALEIIKKKKLEMDASYKELNLKHLEISKDMERFKDLTEKVMMSLLHHVQLLYVVYLSTCQALLTAFYIIPNDYLRHHTH